MTGTQQLIVMLFGAFIALAGLALLFRGKKETKKEGQQKEKDEIKEPDKSRIEILGLKLEMSTPALMVFLVGCAMFVLPFFMDEQPPASPDEPASGIVTLHSYSSSTVSSHTLELSALVAKGRRNPAKVDDLITVEFTLTNVGEKSLRIGETFVAARNPEEGNRDFGHGNENRVLKLGEQLRIRAETIVNAAGRWTFWPCYTVPVAEASEEVQYCPSRWESFVVAVEP